MDLSELRPGLRLSGWFLVRPLGRGAAGEAWAAEDEHGRPAVVKVLRQPTAVEGGRLLQVRHPGLVEVLAVGAQPLPHVVTRFVQGRPLSDFLRSGAAPAPLALGLTCAVADALAALHAEGLTHGDLRPGNVLVTSLQGPRLKVVGFGQAGARHGTALAYAAPERLAGGPTSPAADCFSLGLLLWELVHGHSPWSELELSEALQRRSQQAPVPTAGSPVAQDLLLALLEPQPEARIAAAEVVNRLLAAGVPAPPPDLGQIWRRARSVHLFPEIVREALDGWLARGGRLALVGGSGSGRSHALEHLACALAARGRPFLRLWESQRPWTTAEDALQTPALPGPILELPLLPDPEQRAARATRLLLERCPDGFAVLCDDVDEREPTTLLLLEALARRGEVTIAVTGRVAPAWADDQCLLEPLGQRAVANLVREVLGPLRGGEQLAARVHAAAEGQPGSCVAVLMEVVRTGGLTWRARRWHIAPSRLAAALERGAVEALDGSSLSADAALVGSTVALLDRPSALDALGHLLALPEERLLGAVDELVEAGLVRLDSRRIGCRGAHETRALAALATAPQDVHSRVVDWILAQHEPDWPRVGWHLVRAGDGERVARHGAAILAAALTRDGAAAAPLADALWELEPAANMVAPRLRILLADGRIEEARALAEARLGGRAPGPEELPVIETLARILGDQGHWDDALRCVDRARWSLGSASLSADLTEIEVECLVALERWDGALEAVQALADRPPPSGDGEDLDRWLRLRILWARAREGRGQPQDALEALVGLPESLGRGRHARAALDGVLGRLLERAGRARDALDAYERAAQEEAGLTVAERAAMLGRAALARDALGDFPGAVRRWEQADALLERLEDASSLVEVRSALCVAYRVRGRWEESIRAGRWAADMACARGEAAGEAVAASRVGGTYLAQGFWREAQAWLQRAEVVASEHGVPGIAHQVARCRAEVALERRDPRATALAERARQIAAQVGQRVDAARASALLAFCHARAGRPAELESTAEEAVRVLRKEGAGAELAEARLWIAEAWLQAGRVEQALGEATRSLVFSEEVGHVQLQRRAQVLVERIRAIQGPAPGRERLDRLLELAQTLVEERELDRVLEAIARAALDLLEAERAFVLVREGDGELRLAAQVLARGVEEGRPSMAVVRRVMEDGQEVLAADLGERKDLRDVGFVDAPDLRSAMCVPLSLGGDRVGVVYVDSRAVSNHELASAARMLRALGAFAAVAVGNARHLEVAGRQSEQAAELAHDLRSPATAIHLIVSEILARRPPDDPERDALLQVLEGAQRIRAMAGTILEEARPPERPVELSNLVERVVGMLRHVAAQRGLRLESVVTPNLWVTGEPQQLARLVTNLVSNALKVAPGGSRVSVGLGQDERGVLGMVRDRGPGVPAGQEEQVFKRGWRAPGAQGGHGLGLYICRRIAEEHGGSIEVRNHPRGGAVFTFRLPRRVRAWDSLAPEEAEKL
ncbi:MAG: ATP-binding protein [Pseudomonadota bacterium]